MIECIFTIDYEIYGNGFGSLRDLVYEPTQKLKAVFDRLGAKFVNFVEVAEFDKIEQHGTDPASSDVRRQIRELYDQGHEIGLHLHPQWANARFVDGMWELDYREYNLCTLPTCRIQEIVDGALAWLRGVLGDSQFTPFSFRAGNWLLQPSAAASSVLAGHGIRLDSSVFKGGMQFAHGLDYRPALENGYYWTFQDDVNVEDSQGALLEVPIYSNMVPFWRMLTSKRITLQQKGNPKAGKSPGQRRMKRFSRLRDYLRGRYPLKLDFCRMTINELTTMIDRVVREDRHSPDSFKPLVAIGHTKDLVDLGTVESFLSYLESMGIGISTLQGAYPRCSK